MSVVISVVGKSKVGKTTFLEGLISEMKQRGYRVAVVKHDMHGFEIDKPGKDSWRLTQAGSDLTAISSPQKIAIIRQVEHDHSLGELSRLIGNEYDIIFTEGFKRDKAIKIEVHRQETGELLCASSELLAVATDEQLDIGVPALALDDFRGMAELIESYLKDSNKGELSLFVNRFPVPLNAFATEMISGAIRGMISALKGIPSDIGSIDIIWQKRK